MTRIIVQPDTDQCGEDMITHAVHVEPINVDLPEWITATATRHMCADKATDHGHYMDMPDVDPAITVMTEQGFNTVVVLAPDYADLEDAFWSRDHSRIAARLGRLPSAWGRQSKQSAVVVDLGRGTVTVTTRKAAWTAL